MPSPEDVRRYRENWQEEVDSAAQYRAMAASETDPRPAIASGIIQFEECFE